MYLRPPEADLPWVFLLKGLFFGPNRTIFFNPDGFYLCGKDFKYLMSRLFIISILVIFLIPEEGWSQSRKKKAKKKQETTEYQEQPTSLSPGSQATFAPSRRDAKSLKKKQQQGNNHFDNLDGKRDEFWDRMEANAKRYKKMEKEMKKPQYSDPMYFGHKKKPKKRSRGKRKFCKECGIVH